MSREVTAMGRLRGYPTAFALALVANALYFFSLQSTFPVLPRFIAQVVVNQPAGEVGGQVGLATAATVLLAVLTRIPFGRLTDRWGKRPIMFAGALCFTAAPLIYSASRGMPLLLLGRMVHGLGLGAFSTAFQALAADLAPEGRQGEALGLAGASSSIALIIAPVAGDWLVANWGYTWMFSISAAAAALSMVMVALIRLPSKGQSVSPSVPAKGKSEALPMDEPESPRAASLRLALAQTGVRAGVLAMAALGIPFGAFITFLPLLGEEKHVVGVGLVYSVYACTVLLTQPLGGWLADRVGWRGIILPGLVITGLATGLFSVGASLMLFTLAGVVLGLGSGLTRGGVDPLVQNAVPPTLRGTAAAIQYTSFDFCIGVGSYLIGLLTEVLDYGGAFVVTGVLCVLGGGLLLMFREAERQTIRQG